MMAQVVPRFAVEQYLEYQTYTELGWKGIIFAILVGSLIFGVLKQNIGFRSIGPNEGGIRELFGVKLWKLGPGPHFYITGFSSVRKAPLAVSQIDLNGEVPRGGLVYQYEVAVFTEVINTREALIARIYFVEDNDKTNMENAENTKQLTALLKRNLRQLLETEASAEVIEERLKKMSRKRLNRDYGSRVRSVLVCELVTRPLSEVAAAIKASRTDTAAIAGVLAASESHVGDGPPYLEAIEGGVGAS